MVLTRGGITAEADPCGRSIAHVAEDHSLDVDGSTPFGGDPFHLAVEDGSFVHPAIEDGTDSSPELLHRIGGEVLAGTTLDLLLEEDDEALEFVDIQFII